MLFSGKSAQNIEDAYKLSFFLIPQQLRKFTIIYQILVDIVSQMKSMRTIVDPVFVEETERYYKVTEQY